MLNTEYDNRFHLCKQVGTLYLHKLASAEYDHELHAKATPIVKGAATPQDIPNATDAAPKKGILSRGLSAAGKVMNGAFIFGLPAYSYMSGSESLGGAIGGSAGFYYGDRLANRIIDKYVPKREQTPSPQTVKPTIGRRFVTNPLVRGAISLIGGLAGSAVVGTAGSYIGNKILPMRRARPEGWVNPASNIQSQFYQQYPQFLGQQMYPMSNIPSYSTNSVFSKVGSLSEGADTTSAIKSYITDLWKKKISTTPINVRTILGHSIGPAFGLAIGTYYGNKVKQYKDQLGLPYNEELEY